jgi:hypothetical protein
MKLPSLVKMKRALGDSEYSRLETEANTLYDQGMRTLKHQEGRNGKGSRREGRSHFVRFYITARYFERLAQSNPLEDRADQNSVLEVGMVKFPTTKLF